MQFGFPRALVLTPGGRHLECLGSQTSPDLFEVLFGALGFEGFERWPM